MPLRITTWNVNGLRNPFSYQPWRDKRTFAAMFDILEADIIIFQETKIQRKDLRDDMVLVPGWDCYFSLPKHKKGYSGVVIYTRQAVCCPIRAEEGITGILSPPNSSTSVSDLPEDLQIGGYPKDSQLSFAANLAVDFTTLDSEGRCVILEFPAFVLIGVYSPANRDETRDDFRLGFLNVLDTRVRNLVAMGKRVILTGDLNVSKEGLDTANAESVMRKLSMNEAEFFSTPGRRLFNHLLEDGKVFGDRDEGREKPVMWDICRAFHPGRKGMFTCWEQKVNARPGNFGSRIDYVLCSLDMREWFLDSNIQEGLLGSDHCPVYATIKDNVILDGSEFHIRDIMNPQGVFLNGQRLREHSTKDMLPLSGKLIPEFDRRQSIRDMFTRKPTLSTEQCTTTDNFVAEMEQSSIYIQSPAAANAPTDTTPNSASSLPPKQNTTFPVPEPVVSSENNASIYTSSPTHKRSFPEKSNKRSLKRVKSGSSASATSGSSKGQQSLKGFFKLKTPVANGIAGTSDTDLPIISSQQATLLPAVELTERVEAVPTIDEETELSASTIPPTPSRDKQNETSTSQSTETSPLSTSQTSTTDQPDIHDPIESKESWSKLFAKPVLPLCEGHEEPCTRMVTKKSGMNCGRSFWMCARPLGPTGAKEKNTQWRCQTFIWCSDWNSGGG